MPIAIVGMSCRLSGGVSTLDDFWTMLSRSRDGWRPIPEERFTPKAFYHPDPHKKGSFNNKGGYFLNGDLSSFDAPFFHITKQEAEAMGMDSPSPYVVATPSCMCKSQNAHARL